jgi:hypothetical protein
MNRAVAVKAASIDAVNAVHAKVIQEIKERRGMGCFAAGAAGFAGAGFGGAGAERVVDSSLLMKISRDYGMRDGARSYILKILECFQ